jgi:GT2 family glycosyltransferase
MPSFQLFLSVVYVVRNQVDYLEDVVRDATSRLGSLVTDYELIIVDNASEDDSVTRLKNLTARNGYPNLQVFSLTKDLGWP